MRRIGIKRKKDRDKRGNINGNKKHRDIENMSCSKNAFNLRKTIILQRLNIPCCFELLIHLYSFLRLSLEFCCSLNDVYSYQK